MTDKFIRHKNQRIYTVFKTMFMYFCVWFSWPWGWLQMWLKHVFLVWNSQLVWPLSL